MSSLWFTSEENRHDIASKFDHMSLQEWGLSNRTLNALLGHDFKMTVGDVIRADEQLVHIRGLGEAGLEELMVKVSRFMDEAWRFTAYVPPDQSLRESREGIVERFRNLLPLSIQRSPLDQLHLDRKTHEALVSAGITTIGELYKSDNAVLSDLQGFHAGSLGNVNGSLILLLNSINQENDVDWFVYWERRHISLLPTTTTPHTPPERIIEELPLVIEDVLCRELDERSGIIIQRRYGLGKAERLTLEDIGNAFGGLSRERIRQIEKKALKKLQGIFIEQHYAGREYHVHPAIHSMIQTIHALIEAEASNLLLETNLLALIGQALHIDIHKIKSSLFLFLPLMGIERIEFDYPNALPVWGYSELAHLSVFENGMKRLDDLLTRETPLPQAEFDILVTLNKKAKKPEKLTSPQLAGLIRLCHTVERREDGLIWGKFEYLKGRGNQVERLLSEAGAPMSIADMAREINHRLVPLGQRQIIEQNLTNQIIGDHRFVPIGRSGTWGLKAWTHIDTKSVLTLMEECFITQNQPVTTDEIFIYVSTRRPVSKHSIIWYLSTEKETFVKTSRTTWGLAKWSSLTNADIWDKEQVADFVANIFKHHKAKELRYKMLKEALMKEAGVSAKQAQGLLNQNPVIKTRVGTERGNEERMAIFQPNYKAALSRSKLHSPHQKMSLRQQIEESVHAILMASPNKQMPMADLAEQLSTQLNCPKSTLYATFVAMDSIERKQIPGSTKKICQLKEDFSSRDTSVGNLRQKISRRVKNILEAEPNKQMNLADLVARLQKEYHSPKATLYAYITSLDFIEKLDIPHSHGKICRMKELSRSNLFPQAGSIANAILREKVERTLSFLTEENVDIGLFLLSKEFEATLKTYFLKASARGKLSTLPPGKGPDKWLLNGMVECAKENGIITDHATFHYLRQTRNDRAHGTMPSLAERQLLMKHVQYIAGLYIDYIKILDDLTQNV